MTIFYTNIYQYRGKLLLKGIANGKPFMDDISYEPYLFVLGDGPYKTVDGKSCKRKDFKSIKDQWDWIRQYENMSNHEFFGLTSCSYVYLNDHFPGEIQYDPKLISVVSIDIEVDSRNGMPKVEEAADEITAITLTKNNKIITFGTKYYKPTLENVEYVLAEDEEELLKRFLEVWNSEEWLPDVITGWYIESFDIPYIINRLRRVFDEKAAKILSPWNIINEREIMRGKSSSNYGDRTEKIYEIAGITQLDYLQLYKKFTPSNHSSYRLDSIAQEELGQGKLDYSEYRDLNELYEKNPAKYYDYNIIDALRVAQLEEKLGFIQLVIGIAYTAKVNYVDALTTIRPWDIIIHNYLMERKIVIPQLKENHDVKFRGAYVKEPQLGLFENVLSFDFEGLYPRILSQHNISPETFIKMCNIPSVEDILKAESFGDGTSIAVSLKASICGNGCLYTNEKRGFIGEIVDKFIDLRKVVKKSMLTLQKNEGDKNEISKADMKQQALKILTNGLYGACGNRYFRWFSIHMAEAVTVTGQIFAQWVGMKLNQFINKMIGTKNVDYLIASDTDSVYLNLGPLIDHLGLKFKTKKDQIDYLDNISKEIIEPKIDNWCRQITSMMNVYQFGLNMKREAICDKAVWRAAKNYGLNIWDLEGVRFKEPKIKIKGLEIVRSSTPKSCRDALKEALRLILQSNEESLHDHIKMFHEKFMQMSIEDIAFPRGVDGIVDYYDPVMICKKGTPIHVRGCIVFNEFIRENKLEYKYPMIRDKEKIKFFYLKEPNIYRSHVMALPDRDIPPQLELDNWIDRRVQYDKTFLSPIKSILNVIGWQDEKRVTAMMFFKA